MAGKSTPPVPVPEREIETPQRDPPDSSRRDTMPIDLHNTTRGPWLQASFVQLAPDGSMPVIRIVVTRARGFALALDSTVE